MLIFCKQRFFSDKKSMFRATYNIEKRKIKIFFDFSEKVKLFSFFPPHILWNKKIKAI